MPRYWVMAPVESKPPELFDKVWHFDLANDLISIGWEELGDVSHMSRDELSKAVAATYPEKPQQTKGLYANMLWAFYHEIRPGDFVIARRGRKTLAAVGTVHEAARYTRGKHPAIGHPGFLKVAWQEQPRDKVFSSVVFPMHTLAELAEAQFQKLVEGSSIQPEPSEAPAALEDPTAFVLEKVSRGFHRQQLRHNFQKTAQDLRGRRGKRRAAVWHRYRLHRHSGS
jgi:5-methylcytosine-specific restriction protein B